jgi:MFS transporter, LPLT family, lysophospholipid transporter
VATALGVISGAALAAHRVPLRRVPQLVPLGVLFGLLIALGALSQSVAVTAALMVLVGLVGGVLIVPMNALLQHRGYQLLTAGRSIAVQGFNENASILLMLGLYALAVRQQLSSVAILVTLGLILACGMSALWVVQTRHRHVIEATRARHRVS